MAIDEGLLAWAEEALEPMGRVTMRKMMGGATLYLDGIIFAIMVDGELWLKSDAEADPVWDAIGAERFTVTFKDGTVDSMK
jgi:DNA transformation protein